MNGWMIEWLIDWIELVMPLSKIDILPWFAGWSVLWPLQHILFLAQDRGIQKRLTRILISQDSLCDVWSASSPYRHEMRITGMCGGRFVTLFFCLFGSRVFPNYRKETRIACAMFGRLPFLGRKSIHVPQGLKQFTSEWMIWVNMITACILLHYNFSRFPPILNHLKISKIDGVVNNQFLQLYDDI